MNITKMEESHGIGVKNIYLERETILDGAPLRRCKSSLSGWVRVHGRKSKTATPRDDTLFMTKGSCEI
jgi:hypothetical protein